MQRRGFLALLASSPLAGARNRIDFSRVAVLTDEMADTPQGAIDFCKKHGLQWVELRNVPGKGAGHYGSLPEDKLKEAAKQFRDNGLKVAFLNTGFFKITLPGTEPARAKAETPEAREKRIARHKAEFDRWKDDMQKAIRSCHAFDVNMMRVFTFLRVAEPRSVFPQVAQVLGEMTEMARKEGIRMCVENEGACNVVTCPEIADFMKLMPQKNFGINWDPYNGLAQKETPFPDGYALLPKNRLWNVQMKGHSLLDEKRKLPWREIFNALDKDGYKGTVGLETHYFDGTMFEKSDLSVLEIKRILAS
jgi:sugar phosphate isomerase/epimerase